MEIAKAIYATLSAGCGMETSAGYGTVTQKTVVDEATNTQKTISFYRPLQKRVSFKVVVRDDVYTGTDIVADTKDAIANYVNEHATNYTITDGDIVSAIAAYGTGIVCTSIKMFSGVDELPKLAIRPNEAVSVDSSSATQIEVTVV